MVVGSVVALLGGTVMGGAMGGMMAPLNTALSQFLYSKFPNVVPEYPELIMARARDAIKDSEFLGMMSEKGYSSGRARFLQRNAEALLSPPELINAKWRGVIDDDKFKQLMSWLQISEKNMERLLKVYEYLPSPVDLVRFAVREVYTPEIVDKYRMAEDFPEEFGIQGAKVGLPLEQAMNFWKAHWELPSISEGIGMFHRLIPMAEGAEESAGVNIGGIEYGRVISLETLLSLFKTKDVMPYWREKLLHLSYSLPTRVDTRRLYRMGIIDREKVYKLYIELGYRPEDALGLTDFAVLDAMEEARELTKADILRLFREGEIDEITATDYLKVIGYEDENAAYLIELERNKLIKAETTEIIDVITLLYADGIKTKEELFDTLSGLALTSVSITRLMLKAEKAKERNIKLPAKEDLLKWVKKEVINQETFTEYMGMLGYRSVDIDLYIEAELEE